MAAEENEKKELAKRRMKGREAKRNVRERTRLYGGAQRVQRVEWRKKLQVQLQRHKP